jgi:threonine synthase
LWLLPGDLCGTEGVNIRGNMRVLSTAVSPLLKSLRCLWCDYEEPADSFEKLCSRCGATLQLIYEYERLSTRCRQSAVASHLSAMELVLSELVPLWSVIGRQTDVGRTPLICAGGNNGAVVYLKNEGQNPSGSIKDRASEVVVAYASAVNCECIAVASTGNAGASLAWQTARAGQKARVYLPSRTPLEKTTQIRMCGADIVFVDGSYDDAYDLCELECQMHPGWINRNTGLNALTREGKKICAFEIYQQLGWRIPEWVIVPVGDGNVLSGLWKGFVELHSLGLVSSKPRMVAAQARASNAFSRTYDHLIQGGGRGPIRIKASGVADSIRVDLPRDWAGAFRAIVDSNGVCVESEEKEIQVAMVELARRFGVFAEPASSASYAAFKRLMNSGGVREYETVVCVITGSGLKDVSAALSAMEVVSKSG